MLWDVEASADVSVGTPSFYKRYLYVNGGYPQSGTFAIDVNRREVIWQSRLSTYISSMVFYKDYLYAISNNGELGCIDAKNGTVVWRERFKEDVQASPFVADGNIYLTFRNGVTKVFKPDDEKYIEVSENRIPGTTDASMAVVDGLIYYRGDGMLYCIGEE
jgi:outer membrane protein assembly factor BamB